MLTKAGWIKESFVNDAEIKVKWTPKGEQRMRELLHLEELPRAINGAELSFMIFLARFYFDNPFREESPDLSKT